MKYRRVQPSTDLQHIVQCFWTVEDEDVTPRQQKIIPDGYPELIFHFGDPYRINLKGGWKIQTRTLLAGQVRKPFMLQNTGSSFILGVKLQPAAVTHLFGIAMHKVTDCVVDVMDLPETKELSALGN